MEVYADLAETLCSKRGLFDIRQKLQQRNRLDRTYWVCAVSVNQHASICPRTSDRSEREAIQVLDSDLSPRLTPNCGASGT